MKKSTLILTSVLLTFFVSAKQEHVWSNITLASGDPNCVFDDYCLLSSYYIGGTGYKKEDSLDQQIRIRDNVKDAIAAFDTETYNEYIDQMDTSFHINIKHFWQSFNNHRRVMNEGEHNLDLNEEEVFYLDSLVKAGPNASWSWCKSMLGAYKRYKEHEDDRDSTTNLSSYFISKDNNSGISVFPNPTRGILAFQNLQSVNGKSLKLQVFSLEGKSLYTGSLNGKQIDLSHLQNGLYFIKLFADREEVLYEKIQILHK